MATAPNPSSILDVALERAISQLDTPIIESSEITERVRSICRNKQNRACVRFLMSGLLAKVHSPSVDIRKPYTQIGDEDSYSGRTYDEAYITAFIQKHDLPCNSTTAFLTPAFRNRNVVLTPDVNMVGRPPKLYQDTLRLLTDVHTNTVAAEDLLAEVIRCLIIYRNERRARMEKLLEEIKSTEEEIPLSAEAIVTLIQQHLASRGASRLPVLIVAAAYKAAEKHLGERVLPLQEHTAADKQTGALGDLEITLIDDDNIITSYEMKMRRVTRENIDHALQKISDSDRRIDNYIFITTDDIEDDVKEYATSIYEKTGGIEIVVLDCIGFLRHFLHLFHRLRLQFLNAYQELVLNEPESAVRQELKEVFLALRKAAESGG